MLDWLWGRNSRYCPDVFLIHGRFFMKRGNGHSLRMHCYKEIRIILLRRVLVSYSFCLSKSCDRHYLRHRICEVKMGKTQRLIACMIFFLDVHRLLLTTGGKCKRKLKKKYVRFAFWITLTCHPPFLFSVERRFSFLLKDVSNYESTFIVGNTFMRSKCSS